MRDVLYSPSIIFSVLLSAGMFTFTVLSLLVQSKLTRVTVVFLGLVLIALAGFTYSYFTKMALNGDVLVSQGLLTHSVFEDYKIFKDVFCYLFPFVTAGIGTNMISDAVLKHQNYDEDFSIVGFLKDLLDCLRLVVGVPCVFICSAGVLLWSMATLLVKFAKWVFLGGKRFFGLKFWGL